MSINPIGTNNPSAVQQSSSGQSNWQNVLNSVSSTLGLSTSALQQQLQSGSSLSSIAQSQGVSQQTLVSAISTGLTQNGQSTASSAQLQQIATNIANRTPGGHGHHHHHGGGATSTEDATSTSTLPTALGDSSSSTTNSLLPADLTQTSQAFDEFA